MSFLLRSSPGKAAVLAAFGVPFAFAACELAPYAEPTGGGGTGTSTTTGATTTSAGGGGAGGSTTTSTTSAGGGGSGGVGGAGGTGGGATTTSAGGGGSGGAGGVGGMGGTGGGATTSAGGGGSGGTGASGGAGGTGGSTTGAGGSGAGGAGGSTMGAGGAGGSTMGAGGSGAGDMDGGAPDAADDGASDAGNPSLCGAVIATFPVDPSPHVGSCSVVTYSTNPPTSGPHYPSWAAFKVYTTPVPQGFYVHSMEHGAVVVQYNCPSGCDADVAALIAYLDARPADPLCVAPLENRFIVTPDPLLDVQFAASAWGASLKAPCFDLPALGTFIDAHYAKAPENFCFDGFDPTAPGSGIPADCGSPVDAGSD